MPKPYHKPHCPHCAEDFQQLGIWLDEQGRSAIFFCTLCGKALGAQLLKPLPTQEEGPKDV